MLVMRFWTHCKRLRAICTYSSWYVQKHISHLHDKGIGQLLEIGTDPWWLSGRFIGIRTMVLNEQRTWFWHIITFLKKNWKNQITRTRKLWVLHWFFHENHKLLKAFEIMGIHSSFWFWFLFSKTWNWWFFDAETLKKSEPAVHSNDHTTLIHNSLHISQTQSGNPSLPRGRHPPPINSQMSLVMMRSLLGGSFYSFTFCHWSVPTQAPL